MSSAQDLQRIPNQLREEVLKMVVEAGAGHVAGPLSSAEIITILYFSGIVDFEQDKIILSCGHYAPVLYAALARRGVLSVEELKTFMRVGSRLPGHPERGITPGIEVSAGPLGQGLSVAVGIALGQKIQGREGKVYCIVSDGEIQEGQVWEAINLAVKRKLDNLILILDRNQIQIEHFTSEVVDYGNLVGRFEAFGMHTIEVNGHDLGQLLSGIEISLRVREQPAIVIARTIGGKGVSFMENDPVWHDRVPSKEELIKALKELNV